jgi:hypothetical protein
MQTIDHNTITLEQAAETDTEDLYVVVRRIPHSGGTLLHAYESEVLVPLSQFIAKQKGKT